MIESIEISLKSFESKLLKNVVSQILTIFQKLPLTIPKNSSVVQGRNAKNKYEMATPSVHEVNHELINSKLLSSDLHQEEDVEINSVLKEAEILNNSNEFVSWKCSHFSFPITEKKFIVLRSPHIDKKSREQFKIQYFKDVIFLKPNTQVKSTQKLKSVRVQSTTPFYDEKENKVLNPNNSIEQLYFFQLFVENLKRIKFFGVQIKIRIIYRTFL